MHSPGRGYDSEMWTGFKLSVRRQRHENIYEVGFTYNGPVTGSQAKVVGTTTKSGE